MIFPRALVASIAALSALAGGALFLSGCGGGASAAPTIPKTSANLNRIAFSSNRDGDFEIYTMNPDGSDVQRITTAAGDDTKPAWSRDKTKLAFVSERDGNSEIYVVNVVNGQASGVARRLTSNPATDRAPSWNPQGTELVFQSNRDFRRNDNGKVQFERALYIVNVATLGVRRLTQRPDFLESNPTWSPRGDLIAFESEEDPSRFAEGPPRFLFTIKDNGEDLKQITSDNRTLANDPSWHPNGESLIFYRSNINPVGLYTINVDGTNEKALNPAFPQFFDPAYSPDGKQIACSGAFAEGDTDAEIVALNADDLSQPPKRLTVNPAADLEISW